MSTAVSLAIANAVIAIYCAIKARADLRDKRIGMGMIGVICALLAGLILFGDLAVMFGGA